MRSARSYDGRPSMASSTGRERRLMVQARPPVQRAGQRRSGAAAASDPAPGWRLRCAASRDSEPFRPLADQRAARRYRLRCPADGDSLAVQSRCRVRALGVALSWRLTRQRVGFGRPCVLSVATRTVPVLPAMLQPEEQPRPGTLPAPCIRGADPPCAVGRGRVSASRPIGRVRSGSARRGVGRRRRRTRANQGAECGRCDQARQQQQPRQQDRSGHRVLSAGPA